MKLDGRRESKNVEDRRGMSGSGKAGLGIGGLIIAALITWLMGGDPLSVLQEGVSDRLTTSQSSDYQPTQQDEELARFSKQILAGTEDVWTKLFADMGRTYQPPRLVLFTDAVQSGCGQASSQVGPFYCSADQTVYIDLSFFKNMQQQLGSGGDFAYAYVIAHEVGHHVQNLLGTLGTAHEEMSRMSQTDANRMSVRLELQADYYAGVWANYDNRLFGSLEDGDIEEGLEIASRIGDDYLQKKAQGYTVPDSFNHGTSAQRVRWLKAGLDSGNPQRGDTFSVPYSQL